MEMTRPFDSLNKSKDKTVIVDLKNGKQYVGQLQAFDTHINVVLINAEEHENGELKKKIGTVFIRGDTITIISPQ